MEVCLRIRSQGDALSLSSVCQGSNWKFGFKEAEDEEVLSEVREENALQQQAVYKDVKRQQVFLVAHIEEAGER
jgi:hypothetical protein